MKKKWIYQIRGLAIIAVVLCHQQGVLHSTEVLQFISLYSVTTLIFMMGVTKAISLKKFYSVNGRSTGIFMYSLKSMSPILYAYIVATLVYSNISMKGNIDYNIVLTNILAFSASPPFYFIKHYIWLSLWAPLLYSIIKNILNRNIRKKYKWLCGISAFILIWAIGYLSIGKIDIFGQSYLFVYSLGLLIGQIEIQKVKRIYIFPSFLVLLIGAASTKRFYWARLSGEYNYAGGIDVLSPKLQLNPPNISIVLYSLGVIAVAYFLFEICNNSDKKYVRLSVGPFTVLGKYSLDIFLWHMYIQGCLNVYFYSIEINVFKWIIYYGSMFLVPIGTRVLYNKTKARIYNTLTLR